MPYDLVCLGNPLLDLQLDVDQEILTKYDLKDNDAILAEEKHLPIFDEIINNPKLILVAGGAAQNTARGAQYILPPNSVCYFGAVGDDIYKQKLVEANAQYGLTTKYMIDEHETGKCAALIYKHNRSLVTDLGAANHFKPSHFDIPENWEIVQNAKVFYIGGFHLTVSPEAIIKLGKHAAETNKPFALNLSAPFIPQFFKEPLAQSIPYADYIIGNESEAAAFAEANGLEATDVETVGKYIAKLPKVNTTTPRVVILTQGTEETVAVSYNKDSDSYDVKKFPVVLLESSKIADTNGAGDAFAAGFIASVVQGKTLAEGINVGQWAAQISLQEVGPSFPFPKQTYA
ncbi:adenosine kinase [Yamadazyma tenuis]|uniref:Adenosine kinase n=1 Tax=Candida tenuis (strain ATCC 10573 / BCRC 21748 / CBS 615 / JCM 9827 / NBRC 10315 / NRRL Y-1498 / VKM Y-70) TaxID=590646 RepID=G3AZD1_CANTC|nr:Ribokinase-like protein [Yamadazyma tenuis ATCC 10573]EGV66066.1 Ribokinase-like protein [Yamadazyma tenuis ATCC 10573]WEJ95587.1 adenosine kinase [Yamadazyma tenuis]